MMASHRPRVTAVTLVVVTIECTTACAADRLFAESFTRYDVPSAGDALIVDVNADGHADAVVVSYDQVDVLLGSGDGSLAPQVSYPCGGQPTGLAVGDVDNDGDPDIATANNTTNDVAVLLNHGDGTFAPALKTTVGVFPYSLALADLDNDGTLDMLVAIWFYQGDFGRVATLHGVGNGTFTYVSSILVGREPRDIHAADLNGDGFLDAAVLNFVSGSLSVLLTSGVGSFGARVDYQMQGGPTRLSIADVNGDGRFDLVSNGDGQLTTLIGHGDGTFGPRKTSAIGGDFSLADCTGDGVIDAVALGVPDLFGVAPGVGDGTFGPQSSYPTTTSATAVASGDLDGDGAIDALVSGHWSSVLAVHRGNGAGGFVTVPLFATSTHSQSLVLGDLDADGLLDMMVAGDDAPAGLWVWSGTGDGGFVRGVQYDGGGATVIRLADLNEDGDPDVVSVSPSTDHVSVRLGVAGATFGPRVDYVAGATPSGLALADLNADGHVDAVATNRDDGTVSILLGDGSGAFASRTDLPCGSDPFDVAIGDATGDGLVDIVVGNYEPGTATMLPGLGDGTFGESIVIPFIGSTQAVAVGDVTGDGVVDVVTTAVSGWQHVVVAPGLGGGAFGFVTGYPTAPDPMGLALVDVDGDGLLDAVTPSQSTNAVAVVLGLPGGAFGPPDIFGAADGPVAIAVGDVNGDGRSDLAVCNTDAALATIHLHSATTPTSVADPAIGAPVLRLDVRPSVTRGACMVHVSLTHDAVVAVDVWDTSGRLVQRLGSDPAPLGDRALGWDGSHVAPGVYMIRARAGGIERTARVVIAR